MHRQVELLVTLEFELTESEVLDGVFDSLVDRLEESQESSVFDVDALLDVSKSRISLACMSSGSSFKEVELIARAELEALLLASLRGRSEVQLVLASASARPEKLLSSL